MNTDVEVDALRRRVAELESILDANQTKLDRQLQLAAKVHRSLLPQPVCHERIAVDVRYIPIEEVGGDYCQVRFPYKNSCYITICDVTGHGIGPGLLATRVSSEVRYGILYGRTPREIVQSLNHFICDNFSETNLFLTFTVAAIDLAERTITWSGAGHPSPLLIRTSQGRIDHLASQNPLIGVTIDGCDHDVQDTTSIAPGDRLVFYTDGLTETADDEDRQLGVTGLAEIATGATSLNLFETADYILDQVDAYQYGPTTDDKTLLVAEIL